MSIKDNELLKKKIDLLPDRPGSYQMLDKDKRIIYVGKAKSLVKRVKQYFTRPQEGKVLRMVNEIEDFTFIECNSEKEALLLEISLIQKYYPKYNILLKDGKMYPYISLKKNDPYLKISRDNKDKNYYHYGPFPNSSQCFKTINLLNKIYPLRKCRVIPKKACLYYYLGNCVAPCINKVDELEYQKIDKEIRNFLNGDASKVLSSLKEKMLDYAAKMEFEKAAEYKELIESVQHVSERQVMFLNDDVDRDFINFSIREGYIALTIFIYKKGNLLGRETFVEGLSSDLDTVITDIVCQFYLKRPDLKPKEICISLENLCPLLSETLDITVTSPSRGKKKEILLEVLQNAQKALDEHFYTARLEDDKEELLEQLGNLLMMESTPLNIELYDNSHLQGAAAVGVMVKYINGEPSKKHYRKYIIESDNKKDDLSSMAEVFSRRLKRMDRSIVHDKPDLIICDGGVNQVNVVKDILEQNNISDIKVCGLVKNNKHETESLYDGDTGELIDLDKRSNIFFLLMRMQDEVHRFAISFFRNKKSKDLFQSFYDDIKGIGKQKRRILLTAYPTIDLLKKASYEELSGLVGKEIAKNIQDKLSS